MDLLSWIESSLLGTWVRESISLWAYPGMLSLHTIGLGFVVGASAAIDLRLLGWAPSLSLQSIEKFFPLVWVGFWINALSGLLLLAAAATSLMTNAIFVVKLVFVVLGVVNVRVIKMRVFGDRKIVESGIVPRRGRALAWMSLGWWILAIVFGRLTAYTIMINETFGWEV